MATLNTLPFETLTQILSGLSTADLVHVSYLSSRLCAVAEHLLYKAPRMSEAKRPSLAIFLRTLLLPGRESLATRVTSLRVDWHRGYFRQDPRGPPRPPHSPESRGTELGSLLHLLPSLQVLEIVPTSVCSDFIHLLESYDGQLSTLPLGLQSLREFHCPCASLSGFSLRSISTLLKLPSIRSIDTPINIQNGLLLPIADNTAATSSSITNLRLFGVLPTASLGHLLKDLSALTHFSYYEFVYDDFDIPAFMRVLEPLRNTLEHLHLDFTTEREPYIEDGLTFIGGSLRTWPVLRTLICGLMPLLGKGDETAPQRLVDVLPPSLRELQILPDHYWTYEERMTQAVQLMGLVETVVPELKCLAVVRRWDSDWQLEERLARLCKDAGVLYDEDDSFSLEVSWYKSHPVIL